MNSLIVAAIRCSLRFLLLEVATVVLAFLAFLPSANAVVPPPDGGYSNGNTAEGKNALFSLTTGYINTALGFHALYSTTSGFENTATGYVALANTTDGFVNTADGAFALWQNTTGRQNTAIGAGALARNTTSCCNTAIGVAALSDNITGFLNTAIGISALLNSTGSSNIALGDGPGANLIQGDNNIYIGNQAPSPTANESNTIRIGGDTGYGLQTATFIAGISGTPVVGDAVMVDGDGQLGTVASSRRFKDGIRAMDKTSEAILTLRPVTFHYKSDKAGTPRFGLIAEEVAQVNPDLVVCDKEGKPYTVRYDAVNAMLLNEFLKEHRKVEEQEASITRLKSTVAKQEATIAQQRKDFEATAAQEQKEIQTLTASLKEQAAQIQKVSAQLEASKPAPQVVNNP
jgi:Chaperone of endosialidase